MSVWELKTSAMRGFRGIMWVLAAVAALVMSPAAAERRIALVIGNDAYDNVPVLLKAGNDARAMEQTLSELGFDVISAIDATRREMNRSLQELSNRVQPGDIAMFFYAGHAIEIEGENYLLPTDIPPAVPGQEGFVRGEAISLNRVLDGLRATGARLNIAVLDACRDNPFAAASGRSVGAQRGLSRIVVPGGMFVMYSADAGQSALDRLNDSDPDPNSVFTRSLLPLMKRPGLDLVELARQTRREVNTLAGTVGHQQTPAYYDSILGEFKFALGAPAPNPPTVEAPAAQTPASTPQVAPDPAVEIAFWQSAEASGSAAAYQVYLDRFPSGIFADLARVKLEELSRPAAPNQTEVAARTASKDAGKNDTPALRESEGNTAEQARRNAAPSDLEDRIARFKAEQNGPGYNCTRARKRDEIIICNSAELSALDRVLNDAYRDARTRVSDVDRDDLRAGQSAWLAERSRCRSAACIRDSYVTRIGELDAR